MMSLRPYRDTTTFDAYSVVAVGIAALAIAIFPPMGTKCNAIRHADLSKGAATFHLRRALSFVDCIVDPHARHLSSFPRRRRHDLRRSNASFSALVVSAVEPSKGTDSSAGLLARHSALNKVL